jgi:uncharacterized protein
MPDRLRVFFATDLHGSTVCFRKVLNTVRTAMRPSVLIIGGDITGKRVIPIYEGSDGRFYTVERGVSKLVASSEGECDRLLTEYENQGSYAYLCESRDAAHMFEFDEATRSEITQGLIVARVREWVSLATKRLTDSSVRLIINTGNDDPFAVDDVLRQSERIEYPEGRVLTLGNDVKLLSLGYSNLTPWRCARELSEPDLRNRISRLIAQLGDGSEFQKVVFNFHCPPVGTELDQAVEVDPATLKPKMDSHGAIVGHVGSIAVREAIERWKPALGLHGHIHDVHAYELIGTTKCFNPGSEYSVGHLRGVYFEFSPTGTLLFSQLTREDFFHSDHASNSGFWRMLLEMIPGVKGFLHGRHERKVHDEFETVKDSLSGISGGLRKLSADVESLRVEVAKLQASREEDGEGSGT